MAALDTRFNLDPARLNPGQDNSGLFLKGFAGIGDTIQRNRDYAARLQEMRDRMAIAGQESDWRRQQSELQQRQWEREQARQDEQLTLYKRKEDWDEAHPPAGAGPTQFEEVPDPDNPGHTMLKAKKGGLYDEDKARALAVARSKTPGTRPLSPTAAAMTKDAGESLYNLTFSKNKWKDDYAGTRAFGEMGTDIEAGIFNDPTAKEAQNWWSSYRGFVSAIRKNKLYGAALSPAEQDNFNSFEVHPGMRPEQIKSNIDHQREIVLKAATSVAGQLLAGGADPTAVEQQLHVRLDSLGFKLIRDEATNRITSIEAFPVIPGAEDIGREGVMGGPVIDLGGSQ